MAESTTTTDASTETDSPSFLRRIWNRLTDNGSMVGFVRLGVIFIIVLYAVVFLVAFGLAILNAEWAAGFFDYFRDLVTISLTMTGILIVIGLGVILVQLARFVNLLRSEIKPITDDAQQAAKNVRVTTEFVQEQAVEPLVRTQAFLAGLLAFIREIIKLTNLLRRRDDEAETAIPATEDTTSDE